ncbi:MAG: glycoside hydrolase family 30 protein [Bacteroidia bacterium]|nr:glycoside hydrolase family 30 protein [Bacteroidia bacterium]
MIDKILFISLLFIASGAMADAQKKPAVQWVSSTDSHRWVKQKDIEVKDYYNGEAISVEVFPDRQKQVIDGFGGCFNEKGWEVLSLLNKTMKDSILSELFDRSKGCRFNICRMPVGANDYALKWYSLNDREGDYAMENFSVDHDRHYLIPYILAAQAYNPGLKIWASPWSPPAWLKTNNHYACKKSKSNGLTCCNGKEGQTLMKTDKRSLQAYALYLSKFITAYKNEGIDIYALHVQNEYNSCQVFPSCVWKSSDLAGFIAKYLEPRFRSDNPGTEIWLGTVERPYIENIDTVMTRPEIRDYVKGIGLQWGGKGALIETHSKYPQLKIMQTESECGNGSNDWKAARNTFGLMKFYLSYGAGSYMYWNMVLDETGKSSWGWVQNSLITIDRKTKEVTFNPEFYLMKHFSHFIDSKANVLEISPAKEDVVAFMNPGGEIIIVVANHDKKEKDYSVKFGNKKFTARLEGRSFNTFVIQ